MTSYELRKMSLQMAKDFAEILKTDEELLDMIYPPKLMGVEAAASYVGWPINTFYKRIQEIPHSRQGKRLVFSERALYRWMMRKGITLDTAEEVEIETKKRKVV